MSSMFSDVPKHIDNAIEKAKNAPKVDIGLRKAIDLLDPLLTRNYCDNGDNRPLIEATYNGEVCEFQLQPAFNGNRAEWLAKKRGSMHDRTYTSLPAIKKGFILTVNRGLRDMVTQDQVKDAPKYD